MPLVSPSLRPRELHTAFTGCHPLIPAVRGSISHPACYPLQMPVSRLQCRPPSEYAEQRFGPATCEPVYRPQPFPEQRQQYRDALVSESTLRYPCRPPAILQFDTMFQSYAPDTDAHICPRIEYQAVASSIRQSYILPQYHRSQHLHSSEGLPHTSQLNAPVVSVAFEQSSSESVFNRPAVQIHAISEPVEVQSQPVFFTSSGNLSIIPQNSSEESNSLSSNTYVCQNDECTSQSRWRQRKTSKTLLHSPKSQRSRDSRGDSSAYGDTGKLHRSRLENLYEFNVICLKFLQGITIACYADPWISNSMNMDCLSVSLSVRMSVHHMLALDAS